MRQLKISKQPTDPAWEVEKAQAIPFLQQLAAARPLGLDAEAEEKLLRFIVSVATQYRGRGVAWEAWEALLRAGYAGAAGCVAGGHEAGRWLAWWVRQSIIRAS